MKKTIVLMVVLLIVAGCGVLSPQAVTEDNPLGFIDPNQAEWYFQAGKQAAATGQTVGVITGNPAIIGGSVLAGVLIAALGGSYLKKGKK